MTTSNAYIATDGTTVMKVGKANDIKRRERQIAVPMTFTMACLDEAAAFNMERKLRQFVIEQGGIRHQETIDWFKFDARIYALLCEFAQGMDAAAPELDLDGEIHALVARYYKLLEDEGLARIEALEADHREQIERFQHDRDREIERLRTENRSDREQHQARIEALLQEIAVLRYRLEQFEADDDDE